MQKLILRIFSNVSQVLKIFIETNRLFLNIPLSLTVEYLSTGAAVFPKYHQLVTLGVFGEVSFYNIPLKYQRTLR
jgi:hypothetical protein